MALKQKRMTLCGCPVSRNRGLESLRGVHAFADCKDQFLEHVASTLFPRFVATGDVIAQQGDDVVEVFVIRRGAAESTADKMKTTQFNDGSLIGNVSMLFERSEWPYTVRAIDNCDIQVLSVKCFKATCEVFPLDARRISQHASLGGNKSLTIPMQKRATVAVSSAGAFQRRSIAAWSGTPKVAESQVTKIGPSTRYSASRGSDGLLFQPPRAEPVLSMGVTSEKDVTVRDGGGLTTPAAAPAAAAPVPPPRRFKSKAAHNGMCIPDLGSHDAIRNWKFAQQEHDEASRRDLAAWLDTIPFFTKMDSFFFEGLLPVFERRSFRNGQYVLEEGTPTEALHVIYTGHARVSVGSQVVALLGSKDVVGERAISCSAEPPRSGASVIAASPLVVTVAIPRQTLLEMLQRNPWMVSQLDEQVDMQKEARGERSLHNTWLFTHSDPGFSKALDVGLKQKKCDADVVIAAEGEATSEGFLLCRGSIQIFARGKRIAEITVQDMSESVLFGAHNLLSLSSTQRLTIIASSPCIVQTITQDLLRKTFEEYPQESWIFIQVLLGREATDDSVALHRRPLCKPTEGAAAETELWLPPADQFVILDLEAANGLSSHNEKDRATDNSQVGLSSLSVVSEEETHSVTLSSTESEIVDLTTIDTMNCHKRAGSRGSAFGSAPGAMLSVPIDQFMMGHAEASSAESSKHVCGQQHENASVLAMAFAGKGENDRKVSSSFLAELHDFKEFVGCSQPFIRRLQGHIRQRVYLPEQVVLRDGSEVADVLMLNRGRCDINICGDAMQPITGPCILGGLMVLMTRKMITTVTAVQTCFVSTISKHHFAQAFDDYPEDRTYLFNMMHTSFADLCTDFHDQVKGQGLARCLSSLPLLKDASAKFLSELSALVEPKLLLPGQILLQEGVVEPKLYILFEGYCHLLAEEPHWPTTAGSKDTNGDLGASKPQSQAPKETVVGTISNKMVFGEMGAFGIAEEDRNKRRICKTVEFCKVGTIGKSELFDILQKFPEERPRFEQLVHNRLEESVQAQVVAQPFFEGLSSLIISKICIQLTRRLFFPDIDVVQEGDSGDAMFIVNCGKLELCHGGVIVGMLLSGKSFGNAQLFGIDKQYHASMRPKRTCHMLELTRKALNSMAMATTDRRWLTKWRERARAGYESEMKLFRRRLREHRQMARVSCCSPKTGSIRTDLLRCIFAAWLASARIPNKIKDGRSAIVKRSIVMAESNIGSRPSYALVADRDAKQVHAGPPIRFSRGLRRVELEASSWGVMSTHCWGASSQTGRLDLWKGLPPPAWLVAVRHEIPRQLTALKTEARGGELRVASFGM
eukprot:TRINITY_DN56329_c0_g1_i1.p1 TRINITY_DN56329_c0_g1~~TRINITY_DN56329_c0_g1_i1.p1  ORF type:complete len:1322 (-),score=199.05 TRINITY_DN56329_c0_g1_i1:47-4012(-)